MIRTMLVLGGFLALNACSAGWDRATVAATCDGDFRLARADHPKRLPDGVIGG